MSNFLSASRIPVIIILLSLSLAGCGHVSGNYPVREVKPLLPEKFKSPRGQETVLTWVEEGRIHGFLGLWRDTSERAEAFRKLAARSGLDVHKEGAEMFDALSEEGIAEMTLFVFFVRGVSVTCNTGDFQITFTDGTVVQDVGILRYEPRDTAKPYRYTRDGAVKLNSEPVGKDEPLPVVVFVAADHLGKSVESIKYLKTF